MDHGVVPYGLLIPVPVEGWVRAHAELSHEFLCREKNNQIDQNQRSGFQFIASKESKLDDSIDDSIDDSFPRGDAVIAH